MVWAVVAVSATGLSLSAGEALRARTELSYMEGQNEALRAATESLESRVWDLEAQLVDYEQRTLELALVAGVDLHINPLESGLGGGAPRGLAAVEQLTNLSSRSLRLDTALASVERRFAGTPSVHPASGPVSSRFGYRTDPLTGERSFHRGLDIDADPEAPVFASASGVVAGAGRDGGLGLAVRLSHDHGLTTRYGHLSRLVVTRGQEVEQGDLVGFVGRSGRATGYHLHFEVLDAGRAVDPLPYLEPAGKKR